VLIAVSDPNGDVITAPRPPSTGAHNPMLRKEEEKKKKKKKLQKKEKCRAT
jgi:hypothetical protein